MMSVLPLLYHETPFLIFEYIDSFRFQTFLVGIVLLLVSLSTKSKTYSLLLLLSILINAYVIYGGQAVFTPLSHTQSADNHTEQDIKILDFNVWKDNPDQTQALELIQNFNPDIVWLQEIKINAYHKIYDTLAKKYLFSYPTKNKVAIQGDILLSKFPFDVVPSDHIPLPLRHSLLHTKMRIGDKNVHFFGVHLQSPRSQKKLLLRDKQFALLSQYIQENTTLSDTIILTGDMNTVYWNNVLKDFRKKTHLNHHRTFTDIMPTWPSYLPEILQIPLDYVMTSSDMCVDNAIKTSATGSDHYPTVYNLYFCD
jgi:endonuclease/exonuclease/phosphatase (EEP) superfamily protein YafD